MANKVLTMLQVRRILQLLEEGRSKREAARQLGLSRNTIDHYAGRFKRCGLTLSQLLLLNDTDLAKFVYPEQAKSLKEDTRASIFDLQVDYFLKELKRTGVTRKLLWQEYHKVHPQGYEYSQFCERLSKQSRLQKVVMHLDHEPADKLQVDFAGKTFPVTDPLTGVIHEHPVLVCVLPYSGKSFVQILENASGYYLYTALAQCLKYFGGVPRAILSDNMKQFVLKSNRYEPTFNELAEQFSVYYNTSLLATRVVRPRDKASVEKQVSTSYQRIYAPLRNRVFVSVASANAAVMECLEVHNTTPMQRAGHSRDELFYREEQHLLKPLPAMDFIVRHRTKAKVQPNYHVLLGEDKHQYSVPYIHVGKTVQLVYDALEVEVFLDMQRIALHRRDIRRNGYTTVEEHMPKNHQKYKETLGWDADYFLGQGEKIGANTRQVIARLLARSFFPEQTYNACKGILSLGAKYGKIRLEAACTMAMTLPTTTYGIVANILKNNRDLEDCSQSTEQSLPKHDNIRGKESYT
ncbi:MAG: IS21 family transposase [Candidatus Auribacterota bacterium]|jgi:transposase|nr:IS21 family transposase [Candidatus Auribacterota bacterium]